VSAAESRTRTAGLKWRECLALPLSRGHPRTLSSAFEAEGWGFDSLRARTDKRAECFIPAALFEAGFAPARAVCLGRRQGGVSEQQRTSVFGRCTLLSKVATLAQAQQFAFPESRVDRRRVKRPSLRKERVAKGAADQMTE
jgi:hypothetical protein